MFNRDSKFETWAGSRFRWRMDCSTVGEGKSMVYRPEVRLILRSLRSEMSTLFRRARLMVALAAMLTGMHGSAFAATLTYVPNNTDLQDLDHHNVYTWVITSINTTIPSGQAVTGAYLFFDNIRNWDSSANRLFMHLLDTALINPTYRLPGTAISPAGGIQYAYTATDDTTAIPTGLVDNFAVTKPGDIYDVSTTGSGAQGQGVLVANGTANTPLYNPALPNNSGSQVVSGRTESWARGALGDATHSFTTTAEDYYYNFTSAQILKLNSYIANGGDIAIALDPDCHFFNDGINFVLTTGNGPGIEAVPEPASLTLLGLGLAGMYAWRKKQMAAKASLRNL